MFLSRSQNIDNCNVGIGKNIYIHETIKVVLNWDNVSTKVLYPCLLSECKMINVHNNTANIRIM